MGWNILCFMTFFCIFAVVLGYLAENRSEQPPPPAKSGPYTVILTRLEKCKKPDLPYQSKKERSGEAILTLDVEKDDTDDIPTGPTIKGNYTSLKEDPNLRLNITEFLEIKGKWEEVFSISGINCYDRGLIKLARLFHINYNKETCAVPKGTYNFNVDENQVDHAFHVSRVYGKLRRRVVLTSKKKTVLCLELEAEVAPEDAW